MKLFRFTFKDRSLGYKFALLSVTPIIIVTTFIVFYIINSLERSMIEKTRIKAMGLAKLSALSMSNTFVIYNKNLLDNFVDSLGKEKSILYAMIVDSSDDRILAHSDHQNDGKIFDDTISKNALTPNRSPSQVIVPQKKGEIYELSAPIVIGGKKYGVVRLGFSLEEVCQEIAVLKNKIIIIAIIAIVLGVLFCILLARIISNPVRALAEQANRIGAGDFEQNIIYESKDALGKLADSFNKMAEELKSNISMLKENEKKYRLLVENLPNIVFKGYKDWSVDFIDDKIELLTGYSKEDFNSRKMKWRDIVIEEDIQSIQKALIDALKTDKSYVREYRIRTKTGDIRWVQEGSQIVCDEKGEIEFITGAFINVTERKQADEKIKEYSENLEDMVEERTSELEAVQEGMLNLVEDLNNSKDELEKKALELEKMNIKIQEATRLKSQFLANMSHELRTPMNSIIGFTGIILQGIVGELNDEQKKQLNMVYGSAKHLLGLINDILDLSKIEAGKIEIIPSQFEVRELIRTVEKMVSPMIEEKGLTSQVVISEDVPQTIYNDKNRIKQVLINLLSNATKFTESGEIRLTVNADFGMRNADLKEEESAIRNLKSAIRFSVTDTGIGIKPEHLPDIFDEFRQIEGPLKDRPAGTGLGLAISRKMVEMMGGRIWAESEYGKGSRFQFTIPTKEIKEIRAAKRPSVISPEAIDPSKKLVLTIDDEVEAQEILNTYLKTEGYEVIQAYNAMEAMELARKYLPFAITLDIVMPGKDGWDILHELKKDPQTESIPVICISILDNREMGLSLGAIEYMVKPINKDQLMEELQRLEKRFRIYDILIVDDEPQAVELLTQYFGEEGNYMLRKAYGGKEGLSRIKESRPDLIILDLMMPEVDGFEVIRNLKKSEETKDIPIIIVSAKKLTQEEVGYLNKNIEKIIRKGDFSKEELFKDIKKALEKI